MIFIFLSTSRMKLNLKKFKQKRLKNYNIENPDDCNINRPGFHRFEYFFIHLSDKARNVVAIEQISGFVYKRVYIL